MALCARCKTKRAKRSCPVGGGEVCPTCCSALSRKPGVRCPADCSRKPEVVVAPEVWKAGKMARRLGRERGDLLQAIEGAIRDEAGRDPGLDDATVHAALRATREGTAPAERVRALLGGLAVVRETRPDRESWDAALRVVEDGIRAASSLRPGVRDWIEGGRDDA